MANILRIKRRLTGNAGAPSTAVAGELAFNKVDDKLYIGDGVENIVIGGAGHFATNAQLSTETTAREAADSTLTTNLASEVTRATAAEAALGTRIDNVLSNVDPETVDSFTEVVAAFEAADDNLNGAITSLAESASSNLAAETTAREAADATLQSNIDAEASARASADTTLQSNIDTEASTRSSADATLQSNIESEASARAAAVTTLEAADATLQGNIDAEASTRASADSALDTRVTALETEIDGGSF